MAESLFLKSSAPIVANGPAQASSNAVLCTDDRTYQVRQVHSSNSVFILQPSEASRLAEDDSIPSSSLLAIAQCTATLELIPTSPSGIAFLRQALPLYKGPQTNAMKMSKSVMVSTSMEKMEKMGKQAMLENAPLPSNEFDKAWKEMCAFEFEGQAWLPTALELISVWESILSAATVRSVDLGENFVIATLRRVVEEDGHEGVLFDTVINRLRSDDEDLMDGCQSACPPYSSSSPNSLKALFSVGSSLSRGSESYFSNRFDHPRTKFFQPISCTIGKINYRRTGESTPQ